MKSIIVLLLLVLGNLSLSGQHFASLNDVEFQDEASYNKYTDQVFDCCYYLLQTPFDKNDEDRTSASDFIVKWMAGSHVYSFKVDDSIKILTDDREDLLGIYCACYSLEILEKLEQGIAVVSAEDKVLSRFLDYCGNPINRVKITKEIKKMISEEEVVSASNVN
jgi:hypothetical protein